MQAQEGILSPPKKHSLVQVYNFESLPLIAMNIARIGAQIPSVASELEGSYRDGKQDNHNKKKIITAVVGFGPMMWILITPDAPVYGGFRAFNEIEVRGGEIPKTDGDMFLYFSSDKADLNWVLARKVKAQFGGEGQLIEEIILEEGVHSDIESEKKKVFIDNRDNLDTMRSSFVLTQKFKADVQLSCNLPQYRFPCEVKSEPYLYTFTFSNQPKELEKTGERAFTRPVSRGLFFLPSLDLLTSLRMGGIRMGSLAINAKWKE